MLASMYTQHKNGVRKIPSNVEHKVMVIDKATLALAKKAITFEAVPPAQQPTTIKPAASSAGKAIILAIIKAANGIIVNCRTTPIAMALGEVNTRLKSAALKVRPIKNIINDSKGTIKLLPATK